MSFLGLSGLRGRRLVSASRRATAFQSLYMRTGILQRLGHENCLINGFTREKPSASQHSMFEPTGGHGMSSTPLRGCCSGVHALCVYARPTVVGQCSSIRALSGSQERLRAGLSGNCGDGCSLRSAILTSVYHPRESKRRDTRRICGHGRMIRHFCLFIYATSCSQKTCRGVECYLLLFDGYMLSPIEVQYNESFDPGGWN